MISSTAILFYGITSQDDSDNVTEICRRLGLISDKDAKTKSLDHDKILNAYLSPMKLEFGFHGNRDYPIVFFYPSDTEGRWNKQTLMRYFIEVIPMELKDPTPIAVRSLNELAEKLGYWGPTWKVVSLLEF